MQPQSFSDLVNNNQNLGQRVSNTVNTLAPLASGVSTANDTGMSVSQNVKQSAVAKSTGILPTFLDKVSSIGKTVGGLAESAAKFIGRTAVDTVEAPVKYVGLQAKNAYDSVVNIGVQVDGLRLDSQQNQLVNDYKAGRVDRQQYLDGMQQIVKEKADWSKRNTNANQSVINDIQGAKAQTATVVSDALAILTAGASAPLTASFADAGTSAAIKLLGKPDLAETFINAGQKIASKFPDSVVNNVWMKQAVSDATSEATNLTSQQIAKKTALNLLLKRPLVYQTNIGMASDIYKQLNDQKYGSAISNIALAASLTFAGGPIGFALKQGGRIASTLKDAVFGEQSFIDILSKQIGNGDASALFKTIKDDPELVKNFKVMEESNLRATSGQVVPAVNRITSYLSKELGWNLSSMTHEQVATDLNNFAKNREKIVEAVRNGMVRGVDSADAERVTVGRWSATDATQVSMMLEAADQNVGADATLAEKANARQAVIQELQDRYGRNAAWLNNSNLQQQISKIISSTEDTRQMGDLVRGIDAQAGLTGVPKRLAAEMAKDGYIAIMPEHVSAPFVSSADDLGTIKTAFAGKQDSLFQKAVEPLPVLGSVGAFVSRLGLSPTDSGGVVQSMFENNLKANILESLGIPAHGTNADSLADDMFHKLADYTKEQVTLSANKGRGPIIDYRQMTLKDIQSALGVGKDQARKVRDSIHTAMLKVPLQVRGLGDRIMDYNYRINPTAAAFSRAQGAWRFVYNPFFRWQQTTQTEMMAQIASGGKFPTYTGWNKIAQWAFSERYAQLDSTVKMLEDRGIFGGGLSGTGAALEGAGKITTNLLPGEKRSLAGLVQVMAEKTGQPADQFVSDHPGLVADTLRSLVQYSKHEGFINSPLARTLNFAFFPSRYNLKIAGVMAKYISQQPAAMQVALIKSVMQFGSWLKSDEGQAWYSKNSDAIQLFNWLSPLYPLNYVSKILTGQAHSIGDYGQLGGLPFGMISQMLDSEGIFKMNAPYIQPKTGDPLPKYIPNTLRAQANLAIQDLLGSVFSYPGATAGLPSKSSVLRNVAGGVVPGSAKEFTKVVPQLNAEDQAHSDQIKRVMGLPSTLTGANGQQMTSYNGPSIPAEVTLPPHALPVPTTRLRTPTKKKSEYIPRAIQVR